MDVREWLDIRPGYRFVTTWNSDKLHIRRDDTIARALCGRGWMQAEEWADYPAKAMLLDELCASCVRSYRAKTR